MSYQCPNCNQSLKKVIPSFDSKLNPEQWDSIKAGDYFCNHCKGNEGKSGFKYYWKNELEKGLSKEQTQTSTLTTICNSLKLYLTQSSRYFQV